MRWPSKRTCPLVGRNKSNDRLEQHRFAAAALADNRQRLAARNRERNIAQHLLSAEADAQLVQLDQRRRARLPILRTFAAISIRSRCRSSRTSTPAK